MSNTVTFQGETFALECPSGCTQDELMCCIRSELGLPAAAHLTIATAGAGVYNAELARKPSVAPTALESPEQVELRNLRAEVQRLRVANAALAAGSPPVEHGGQAVAAPANKENVVTPPAPPAKAPTHADCIGGTFPAIPLLTVADGTVVDLPALTRGKIVVLGTCTPPLPPLPPPLTRPPNSTDSLHAHADFWTTRCVNCPEAMEKLVAAAPQQKYRGTVQFIGVNTLDRLLAKEMVEAKGWGAGGAMAQLFCELPNKPAVLAHFGIKTVPHHVLIGKVGTHIGVHWYTKTPLSVETTGVTT